MMEKPKLLIIDDDIAFSESVRDTLELEGYPTETGQQGFELAMETSPDFIILDIQLPDMNGLEVLKMLRNSKINGDIPVIAMTSFAMAGDRERVIASGCNGYIEKPIDPVKVIDQIREIIGEK